MAYNNNAENSKLYPRTFYTLYIGPNDNGIGHLIFRLSTKQILTTMKYGPVPMPNNLFKTINETDTFTTKIQINQFNNDCFIGQDDHFDNTKDDGQTQSNKINISGRTMFSPKMTFSAFFLCRQLLQPRRLGL